MKGPTPEISNFSSPRSDLSQHLPEKATFADPATRSVIVTGAFELWGVRSAPSAGAIASAASSAIRLSRHTVVPRLCPCSKIWPAHLPGSSRSSDSYITSRRKQVSPDFCSSSKSAVPSLVIVTIFDLRLSFATQPHRGCAMTTSPFAGAADLVAAGTHARRPRCQHRNYSGSGDTNPTKLHR